VNAESRSLDQIVEAGCGDLNSHAKDLRQIKVPPAICTTGSEMPNFLKS
jgi:hypothetical protein